MGRRLREKETRERLAAKTLDAQLLQILQHGLACSPFEAKAVLGAVKEVYLPFYEPGAGKALPGKISLMAVDADEPAGKPIAQCQKRAVCLTLHRGEIDDALIREKGPAGFRCARIPDLCQETLSQGALLTAEDLAYRVFFVSPRTISRDLQSLRSLRPSPVIPLRGTVRDIGPVLSHRVEIIRLALRGKTVSQICAHLHHSPAAVANYLSTFTRCAQLAQKEIDPSKIAFLLGRSPSLVEKYLAILNECQQNPNMGYHLEELLRLGRPARGKKTGERRSRHE